jgi:N utilization substance protein A
LREIDGVTTPMLVAFGENGVKTIEDLAGLDTDELAGWTEKQANETVNHKGILDGFDVSRSDAEAMIMNARVKAGWIEAPVEAEAPSDVEAEPEAHPA